MRIAIISDTHLPLGPRTLPDACVERLRAAELILHAGDVATLAAYRGLEQIGPPVKAVRGNVDEPALGLLLPETLEIDLAGARIAMIHDAGPAARRLERIRARFPCSQAVVFGHSHMPLLESASDGFSIFNPGSPTVRRRAPAHTMGQAEVDEGHLTFELIALD